MQGLLLSYMGPALPYNSPAATLIPRKLPQLAALLLTAEQPTVELDLDITAGSYNAKVNLLK